MRITSMAACVLLLSSGARAQLTAARITSAPSALAVSALSASAASAASVPALLAPALAPPAFAAAPSLLAAAPAPALSAAFAPALEAAPASAPGSFAAAAGPEKEKTPSGAHAAAALSEFSRLVADLMSGDGARSSAAAAELNKIKTAHLNGSPDAKSTKVLDLKPMQIPVGMFEVDDKAKMLKDMKDKKADEWLRKKSAPVVTDYKGRKRPVDHHHEARAAWQAGRSEVYTHHYFDDKLHELIKGLTKEQFYAVTRAMGLYYDQDEKGVARDPSALPADTRGHTDDPYRSLAGAVRDAGGYDKTSQPFAEFLWANFFRSRVKVGPKRADFAQSVAEAVKLAHDPAAKGLPGYKPE
jgi:hypothetical protein